MKPLVSIIIPAYNAEKWIGYSVESAIAQTWPRKEIIVIDDGSSDRTAKIARGFASKGVKVESTANRGLSAAVNHAMKFCQGDYVQELDADDLLSPDKIERQLVALRESDSKRVLLSSPWARFYFRLGRARFINSSLCQSLSPVEWLLRKMGENLHMQNATWLVSRELAEAAGPWDESLVYDQDGEYFARVLLASEGTRFVPETGIFYRTPGAKRVSYIGNSNKKKESLLRSMKLHIQYLRSIEESERVRKACVAYLQNWYHVFYPSRPDMAADLRALAKRFGGSLKPHRLSWKYAWMTPIFGRRTASSAQGVLPELKDSLVRYCDKIMYEWENRAAAASAGSTCPRINSADSARQR